MKLSRPVDYAMRACVDLAVQTDYASDVRSIAERQGVPPYYLAKIVQQLARAGIVLTSRGSNGGVRLAVSPQDLTLLRIFEAVEGPTVFAKCKLWPGECPPGHRCPYHDMLVGLDEVVHNYLQAITVESLRAKAIAANPSER